MSDAVHETPIDPIATDALATRGLRFELLKSSDDTFESWYHAMNRGFYAPIADADQLPSRIEGMAHRRLSALYDDTQQDAATPVATASSWTADLSVPGNRSIPTWAISTITVAPTHRRRGIARNMMEAELRTASKLGLPIAILTASEATIYERFGFAPAAMRADWSIDTARGKWIGPIPDGRVQLITTEQGRDGGGLEILKRALVQTPGEMHFDGHLWQRLFGMPGRGNQKELRVARYDDADGEPQGLLIYKVVDPGDHKPEIAYVEYLTTATDDAYSALWRYLLELDLVGTVKAELRSVDEPVRWQIADIRAAEEDKVGDHLWVRILDAKAALEARHFNGQGEFVLELSDSLGYANDSWMLAIDGSGVGSVTRLDDGTNVSTNDSTSDSTSSSTHDSTPDSTNFGDNHHLAMNVSDLSKIFLGATSVSTLVKAGRVAERTPGAAVAADAAFRSTVTPWLSTWF